MLKLKRSFRNFIWNPPRNSQGPPKGGGVQTGGLSRSGLVFPFLSFLELCRFFWDFPDLLGDGPGRFPIRPFSLSRPIKSTYEELSPKRVRDTIWTFPEESGKPPGLETPRFSFSQKSPGCRPGLYNALLAGRIHAQYDWTTGVPNNGNAWRKIHVVPRSHPLASPCSVLRFLGVETEGLLDCRGGAGIISIVRWNLRPVIFGVDRRALPQNFARFFTSDMSNFTGMATPSQRC